MKMNRSVVLALVLVLLLMVSGTVFAAETWVTDAKTGVKIGWPAGDWTLISASWSGPAVDGKAEGKGLYEASVRLKDGKIYQVKGEAEMLAGFLDGKVVMQWSDGDSYDGYCKKGNREGKGLFKYADGRTYDGDWKNGTQNGFGVSKDAKGTVVYDGEWKDGHPVTLSKVDQVIGIPWGATDEQARSIMLKRPNTRVWSYLNGKDATTYWKGYLGPYADFNDAEIWVNFYQDKMYGVDISWALKEDQVMDRFNLMKQGLTERYGAPTQEKGKYLDSFLLWTLAEEKIINLSISKNTIVYIAGTDPSKTHPFRVNISYFSGAVYNLIHKTTKPGGISKDF